MCAYRSSVRLSEVTFHIHWFMLSSLGDNPPPLSFPPFPTRLHHMQSTLLRKHSHIMCFNQCHPIIIFISDEHEDHMQTLRCYCEQVSCLN